MQMIDSARTVLAGTAQQQAVWIKSTALERRTAGIYHYRIYNPLGRFVLSLRESAKFLILGLALTVIPGEAVFYGLFFLLFVPYELYMCWRLRIVSHADGALPALRRRPIHRIAARGYADLLEILPPLRLRTRNIPAAGVSQRHEVVMTKMQQSGITPPCCDTGMKRDAAVSAHRHALRIEAEAAVDAAHGGQAAVTADAEHIDAAVLGIDRIQKAAVH